MFGENTLVSACMHAGINSRALLEKSGVGHVVACGL